MISFFNFLEVGRCLVNKMEEEPLIPKEAVRSNSVNGVGALEGSGIPNDNTNHFLGSMEVEVLEIEQYEPFRLRKFVWDTLSVKASKFGKRTTYLPSQIFEFLMVLIIFSNIIMLSSFIFGLDKC